MITVSQVSVICSQLIVQDIKWKIPEINNSRFKTARYSEWSDKNPLTYHPSSKAAFYKMIDFNIFIDNFIAKSSEIFFL